MAKWKVYNVIISFSLKVSFQWDGVYIEAPNKDEAIKLKNKQLDHIEFSRFSMTSKKDWDTKNYITYRNLHAIPEGWEIPMNIQFQQRTFDEF